MKHTIQVFYHFAQEKEVVTFGFSIYRGVVVKWDEDKDHRVLTFIDDMPDDFRKQLVMIEEHKGSLSLWWKAAVPAVYQEGEQWECCSDWWGIIDSIVCHSSCVPAVTADTVHAEVSKLIEG